LRRIDHLGGKTMDGDRVSLNDRALSRRTALLASGSGIGVGIALAAGPVQAQHQVMTNSEGLVAGPVWVSTGDGRPMPAYRAMPTEGTGLGTILVVQEVFGVHAYIADICRRLAKVGYYAIAPELYFRQGDPRYYTDIPSLLKEVVSKVPDEQVMKDLDATTGFAKGEGRADTAKLGITGFCWGGRIVWLYDAYNPAVKAGVAWYGRVVGDASPMTPKHPIDLVNQLHGPVQGLYGGADSGIPNDTVDKMRDALKASSNTAARKSTIKTYPDTPHGFNADYRPSYRKEQAEDGWKLAVAWFKANGVG
jgi:carboxymethylenebutenolidase